MDYLSFFLLFYDGLLQYFLMRVGDLVGESGLAIGEGDWHVIFLNGLAWDASCSYITEFTIL